MNRKEPQPLQKGINGSLQIITEGRNPSQVTVKPPAPPSPAPPPKSKSN
jgi:hypothetical protein